MDRIAPAAERGDAQSTVTIYCRLCTTCRARRWGGSRPGIDAATGDDRPCPHRYRPTIDRRDPRGSAVAVRANRVLVVGERPCRWQPLLRRRLEGPRPGKRAGDRGRPRTPGDASRSATRRWPAGPPVWRSCTATWPRPRHGPDHAPSPAGVSSRRPPPWLRNQRRRPSTAVSPGWAGRSATCNAACPAATEKTTSRKSTTFCCTTWSSRRGRTITTSSADWSASASTRWSGCRGRQQSRAWSA